MKYSSARSSATARRATFMAFLKYMGKKRLMVNSAKYVTPMHRRLERTAGDVKMARQGVPDVASWSSKACARDNTKTNTSRVKVVLIEVAADVALLTLADQSALLRRVGREDCEEDDEDDADERGQVED